MLPSVPAEQPIEIRRYVRVDDELIRRRHRFQDPLRRIDPVLELQVIVMNRTSPAADPRGQPVLAVCAPVDKPAHGISGKIHALGWTGNARTAVFPWSNV